MLKRIKNLRGSAKTPSETVASKNQKTDGEGAKTRVPGKDADSATVQTTTPSKASRPIGPGQVIIRFISLSLYIFYTLVPAVIYWHATLYQDPRTAISARVRFSIAALSGDIASVSGRRIGSALGERYGPEWGAWAARAVLGIGTVGGGTMFALLCFDYISPLAIASNPGDSTKNLISIAMRCGAYSVHIWYGEKLWDSILASGRLSVLSDPERAMLGLSLVFTLLSLFVRPAKRTTSFSRQVSSSISSTFNLSPTSRSVVQQICRVLPNQVFPILLLLRLPLIVFALRQQIFLRPPTPYITAGGTLKVLSSEKSLSGQIVVADNIRDGYRFLRADHSILGGRWVREINDGQGGTKTDLGDSIFATFPLQEVVILAHRIDEAEKYEGTYKLLTGENLTRKRRPPRKVEVPKPPERALIIGLGAGIAAASFSRRGLEVDIVEIDPAVHEAAVDHFGLDNITISASITDGARYIEDLAAERRLSGILQPAGIKSKSTSSEETDRKWSYVIQDCFTGGSVPGELFTQDFWIDLSELVEQDGIIAMNFAGLLKSQLSRAALVTLLSVFEQCRAFGDGYEKSLGPDDLTNMVVFCTMAYSPLLTFRPPTSEDVQRSPLRSHVYSTFAQNEIRFDEILHPDDWANPAMILRRGDPGLNDGQKDTSLATWRAMQKILPPEMWLAY